MNVQNKFKVNSSETIIMHTDVMLLTLNRFCILSCSLIANLQKVFDREIKITLTATKEVHKMMF